MSTSLTPPLRLEAGRTQRPDLGRRKRLRVPGSRGRSHTHCGRGTCGAQILCRLGGPNFKSRARAGRLFRYCVTNLSAEIWRGAAPRRRPPRTRPFQWEKKTCFQSASGNGSVAGRISTSEFLLSVKGRASTGHVSRAGTRTLRVPHTPRLAASSLSPLTPRPYRDPPVLPYAPGPPV